MAAALYGRKFLVRIGIIGCGKQAPKHIAGLLAVGISANDVVLADLDPERARVLADREGAQAVDSVQELLADETVHGVVIATPTPTHAAFAHDAIASGKAFLCEKPLAMTAVETERLSRAAAAAGTPGMVAYTYRSVSVFREAHTLFCAEHVLDPAVVAFIRIGGRGSHQPWKHLRASGGGAINEMLVHVLDLALWFFGTPTEVSLIASDLRRPVRTIDKQSVCVDAEDLVIVRMDFGRGLSVYLEADLLTPAFTQRIEIQGESGTLAVSIQPEERSYLYLSKDRGRWNKGVHELAPIDESPYVLQSRVFLEAARTRMPPEYGTLEDAARLQGILEDIHAQEERF